MTETEQVELLKAWWKRYHRLVLIGLSVIFLSISGIRYWQWHKQTVNEQASNAYEHLMVAFSNHEIKTVRSYANQLINSYPNTTYADTARLVQAKLEVTSGHYHKAVILLTKVVEHAHSKILVDVAHLRLARIVAHQKLYKKALAELAQVTNPSYKPIISEQKGDIFYAEGNMPKALKAYQHAKSANEQEGIGNSFLDMKLHEVFASLQPSSLAIQTS
jgi:predicted negative regulator of RcsB-dependent stress response